MDVSFQLLSLLVLHFYGSIIKNLLLVIKFESNQLMIGSFMIHPPWYSLQSIVHKAILLVGLWNMISYCTISIPYNLENKSFILVQSRWMQPNWLGLESETLNVFCFWLHVYKHIFTVYSENQILPV